MPSAGGVVELINAHRRAAGLGKLVIHDLLRLAAADHASDMHSRGYFSHTSFNGWTWQDRAWARGYTGPVSEVIAHGYPDAASVVDGWMRSSGHRAALMNPVASSIGVAVAGSYWCAVIGLSSGAIFLRGTSPPPPLARS